MGELRQSHEIASKVLRGQPTHIKALYRRARASRALDEYDAAAEDLHLGLVHVNIQIQFLDNIKNAAEWVAIGVGASSSSSNSNSSGNGSSSSRSVTGNVTESDRGELLHSRRLLLSEKIALQYQVKGARMFERQVSCNIMQVYEAAAAGTSSTVPAPHSRLQTPTLMAATRATEKLQHVISSGLPVEPYFPVLAFGAVY